MNTQELLDIVFLPGGPRQLTAEQVAIVRHPGPCTIQQVLAEFAATAHAIMRCLQARNWPAPVAEPGEPTCDICDIRWKFGAMAPRRRRYPLRGLG